MSDEQTRIDDELVEAVTRSILDTIGGAWRGWIITNASKPHDPAAVCSAAMTACAGILGSILCSLPPDIVEMALTDLTNEVRETTDCMRQWLNHQG